MISTRLRRSRRQCFVVFLFALIALVSSSLVSTSAYAEPAAAAANDKAAADLKKKGDDLLGEKRFEEALAAYDQAYALAPNAVLLYNRGRALQFLARYPEALDAIRSFSTDASPDLRAKVSGLPELIADLESHVATLSIRCEVAGARVLVGARKVGECPFKQPVRVNAGPQTVEALAEGYLPFRRDITLGGGTTTTLDIAFASRSTAAILIVKSHITATLVSVDGKALGVVPSESNIAAGEHEVKVERDGYDAASTRVVLKAGDRREIMLDPANRPSILARWWFWTGVAVIAIGVTTTAIALSTERDPPSGNFSPGTVKF